MKAVRRTKEPTLKQMANMASNLHEKFNKPTKIAIDTWKYAGIDEIQITYYLYVEGTFHDMAIPTWEDLQNKYFELMEVANG